jgi:hypothetical protein
MTKPARDANPRWLGFLLAALVAVLVTLFGAGTASAATAIAAQTRVGAHTLVAQVLVGPDGGIDAGQRLGNDHPAYDSVLATGVAAETGAATAEDGGGLLSRLRSFNWRDDTGSIGPRDVHGGVSGGRGVDVAHVWENGDLYIQEEDGQMVRVLDNGNGTSDVVIRDPANPSGRPTTQIKDMPNAQVQSRIDGGRWG